MFISGCKITRGFHGGQYSDFSILLRYYAIFHYFFGIVCYYIDK